MSDSKKTKHNTLAEAPLPDAAWSTLVEVANDTRGELFKQSAAFIAFAEGAAAGAFALATKLNSRLDTLAKEALHSVDELGRALLLQTRSLPEKASQSARGAAHRASESARVLIASPRAKAA